MDNIEDLTRRFDAQYMIEEKFDVSKGFKVKVLTGPGGVVVKRNYTMDGSALKQDLDNMRNHYVETGGNPEWL